MNKHITLLFSLLGFFSLAAIIPTCELAHTIVNAQKQPNETIQEIATLTGIAGKPDLKKLVELTQKEEAQWLRPRVTPPQGAGSTQPVFAERNAIKTVFPENKDQLMALFKKLGWCDTRMPKGKIYKYGLLLGGISSSMVDRLKFLESLCKTGAVKLEKLVLLTGKRAVTVADSTELDFLETIWKDSVFVNTLKTEADIAKALLLKTDFFPLLKQLPLVAIGSEAEKGQPRATTATPAAEWVSMTPKEELTGSCLAISSNPFVTFQDFSLRMVLPESLMLETCGAVDARLVGDQGLGNCLDSLARALFQYDKYITELAKVPVQVKETVKP